MLCVVSSRKSAVLFSAVIFTVFLIAGCSGISSESLESASESGNAPDAFTVTKGSSSAFADAFSVDLSWDPIDEVEGYQLQKNSGDGWFTVDADDDSMLLLWPSYNDWVYGYDKTFSYRVRAVMDSGSEVTPWSDIQEIVTDPGNVLYQVEGTAATASITMRTNSGTEQAEISVPLKTKSGATGIWIQGTNMNPYLSAQATSAGSITCRITVKGEVLSENTSSGRGSIATCSP